MSVSSGTMSVGVMAIFSGLLGAYGLRAMLLDEPKPAPPPPPRITVPMAITDLPAGRTIALSDIAPTSMPMEEMVKQGYGDAILDIPMLVGRTLEQDVKKGDPFRTESLYLEGIGKNIAELLEPGTRAVSMELPALRGGTLVAGTRVDVLFRSTAREATDTGLAIPEVTQTLFEDVKVVSSYTPKPVSRTDPNTIDLRRGNGRGAPPPPMPVVTLGVTLEQANILRAVEGRGDITLVARASDEAAAVPAGERRQQLSLEGLLGVQAPPKPFAMEIYRGGARQVQMYDADGTVLLPGDKPRPTPSDAQ